MSSHFQDNTSPPEDMLAVYNHHKQKVLEISIILSQILHNSTKTKGKKPEAAQVKKLTKEFDQKIERLQRCFGKKEEKLLMQLY